MQFNCVSCTIWHARFDVKATGVKRGIHTSPRVQESFSTVSEHREFSSNSGDTVKRLQNDTQSKIRKDRDIRQDKLDAVPVTI